MGIFQRFLLGVWNIGMIEQSAKELLKGTPYTIRWLKHPYRDRFFADPFLLSEDQEHYHIVAEEYPFYTNKGRIVCLQVHKKSMKLAARTLLIEAPHHLSYPIVYNGKIIPEAYRSGKCCAYDKDTLAQTVIAPFGLIDQTFLRRDGLEWVFAADISDPLQKLNIFYKAPDEDTWHPHRQNPVKTCIHTARPGGNFFTVDGVLYRPVQDSEGCYGRYIRIMRVDTLTPDEFSETEVAMFSSEHAPPYTMGLHTFNPANGFVVVDGYREYHSFITKPLCLKAKKLMKFLGERNA